MTSTEIREYSNSAIYNRSRSDITLAYNLEDAQEVDIFCDKVQEVFTKHCIVDESFVNVIHDVLGDNDSIEMCNMVDIGIECTFITHGTLNSALSDIESIKTA